jgi:hypothetical protein
MERYLRLGTTGEVKRLLQEVSDLPLCAVIKVAFHLLEQRKDPSSKEGK